MNKLLSAIALSLFATQVSANLVTWEFSGKATPSMTYAGQLDDSLYNGVPFFGTITYNDATVDSNADPALGDYTFLGTEGAELHINVGNYTAYAKNNIRHIVGLGFPFHSWKEDTTHFYAGTNQGGMVLTNGTDIFDPKGPFNGSDGGISFYFHDYDGELFVNDSIAFSSYDLSKMEATTMWIEYYDVVGPNRTTTNYLSIHGRVDTLSRVESNVPEPGTLMLLGLALGGLLTTRKFNK
jgi:hypothetical protein